MRRNPVPPERREIDTATLNAIVERTKSVLPPEEHADLKGAIDTLAYITRELEASRVNIARLQRFLFGASEKTDKVLGQQPEPNAVGANGPGDTSTTDASTIETSGASTSDTSATGESTEEPKERPKRTGHGRNGASAYSGATRIPVPHPQLHHGDQCPECRRGKVYTLNEPRLLVRVTATAPMTAKVFECEELRCGSCNHLFPAPPPPGVGSKKYDETVPAMIAELKYGIGVPFNRIEKVEHDFGIPLPASTQWELVEEAARQLLPVHQELVRQGAAGDVLHTDDTSMRVLELAPEEREALLGRDTEDRTGVFTSGIVSKQGERHIALYYTGPRHAGENLAKLIQKRADSLPAPIQMGDALAANTSGDFDTILAACLAHGRRNFVDLASTFPGEVRFVLEKLREVYRNDATARGSALSPEARLAFHQQHSAPLMEELHKWICEQLDGHKVEENSSLGDALRYMRKHWERLTLFLRKAGAPLDNNICERALKRAILHRKNSLFYKTLHGAAVGDLFMSFIHTAEINAVGAFDYLVALLRNSDTAQKAPGDWMPWNYQSALARAGPP